MESFNKVPNNAEEFNDNAPRLLDEIHALEDDFYEEKNIEEQRDILLKLGNKINELTRKFEKEKLSKVAHQLSDEEINNIDQNISDNKDLFAKYISYGTIDDDAIAKFHDEDDKKTKLFNEYGEPTSSLAKRNLDFFLKSRPDLLNTDNISEKLPSNYIISQFDCLFKNGIDISRIVNEFDKETLENMNERKIKQLRDFGIDENIINKIEQAQQEKNFREIDEKLQNGGFDSLTAREIANNYDYLRSKGHSITPKELLDKYDEEKYRANPSRLPYRKETQ